MLPANPNTAGTNRVGVFFGFLAVGFYVVHGAYWVFNGVAAHLLWACHMGALAVGMGWCLQKPLLNAVGVLWLILGNIMWFLYLSGGGTCEPTSPLTHLGGLCIGLIGVRQMGMPRYAWAWALFVLAGLQQVTRWLTPGTHNVNLAFRIYDGWETVFPSYPVYMAVLMFIATVLFLASEHGLRWMHQMRCNDQGS